MEHPLKQQDSGSTAHHVFAIAPPLPYNRRPQPTELREKLDVLESELGPTVAAITARAEVERLFASVAAPQGYVPTAGDVELIYKAARENGREYGRNLAALASRLSATLPKEEGK